MTDYRTHPRAFLQSLFAAAVRSAQPLHTLGAHLPTAPDPAKGRTVVLGAGKAAGAMAQALEALWPAQAPLSGLVVTRYGHVPPRPAGLPQRIDVAEAAHPVPDAAGLAAAERMLALTQGLRAHDLVIALISGGGSALLTLPVPGLSLADKQRMNRQLLDSGAGIDAMNCVRKHLSRIKGGQLAAACAPARVVTLAISDVPGDDPAVIASGPTVADPTTVADAQAILDRLGIVLPPGAALHETPKRLPAHHALQLIATPQMALEAAAAQARAAGLAVHILGDAIEGEARDVGRVHAAIARQIAQRGQPFGAPCVVLSGGETTVTVRAQPPGAAPGRGGRAAEFCMGLAEALQGHARVWALAADTDGIDGSQDNAGAFVAPDTLARAARLGLSLAGHLARNDGWSYFSALGDLLVTGPTHTNVNDFRSLLIL